LDLLFEKKSLPAPPSKFSNLFSGSYPVFEVDDCFWSPKNFTTAPVSRSVRLAITAVAEALKYAELPRDVLAGKSTGVCIGSNAAGAVGNAELLRNTTSYPPYLTPAQRFSMSSPAIGIAREYCIGGPLQTVVTACSAGGDAIGLAASWVNSGLCDIVIAGGVDELYEITYNGFISLMNADEKPCKPFDADRQGLNLGEGAAILVMESEESLFRRQKKPVGYVSGYGGASDAYHLTSPHPDGKGLCLAVHEALESAGLAPEQIAFFNAHGTGTIDNDRLESRFFHRHFPEVPFLSTKGYTGHTLGAAGALEAAFTLGCLKRGKIPPSGGFETPDPDLPAHPVSEVTPVLGRYAVSQTLAFGGNNSVLLLGIGED
jgi:3-oxoacyl-[acyl-carrier-protein] synthase-1/3-oxoacyl-[acyl-carrier-protein] synthase II